MRVKIPNLYSMKEVLDALQSVEESHFRTTEDTGANGNALVVWNALRSQLNLPRLTKEDLASYDNKSNTYRTPKHSKLISNIRFIYE